MRVCVCACVSDVRMLRSRVHELYACVYERIVNVNNTIWPSFAYGEAWANKREKKPSKSYGAYWSLT